MPDWPAFAVEVTQTGGQATVTLMQQSPSTTIYPRAVEVEVQGAAQSAAASSVTLPFGEPVTGWALDPAHRVVGTSLRVWILERRVEAPRFGCPAFGRLYSPLA